METVSDHESSSPGIFMITIIGIFVVAVFFHIIPLLSLEIIALVVLVSCFAALLSDFSRNSVFDLLMKLSISSMHVEIPQLVCNLHYSCYKRFFYFIEDASILRIPQPSISFYNFYFHFFLLVKFEI